MKVLVKDNKVLLIDGKPIQAPAADIIEIANAFTATADTTTIGPCYTAMVATIDKTVVPLPCVVRYVNAKPISQQTAYTVCACDFYVAADGVVTGMAITRLGGTTELSFGSSGTFNADATGANYKVFSGESYNAYYYPQQ